MILSLIVKILNFIRDQRIYWKAYFFLWLYMRDHTTAEFVEFLKEKFPDIEPIYSGDCVIFNLDTGGKIVVCEDTVEVLTKDYIKHG